MKLKHCKTSSKLATLREMGSFEKEAEIDALQDKLDSIPVVQEFKSSQTYVNDLLQLVASTISNNVTDEILISTNGDVLKGETGAAVESKKEIVVVKEMSN